MKFVFALAGFASIAAAIWIEGGHLHQYLNLGSFLIVAVATPLFSLAHHSMAEMTAAFKAGLGRDGLTAEEAARHVAVLSTPRMIAVAMGGFGFIAGLVHVLSNLDDPSKIGAGLAVALIVVFYALLISETFLGPLINRVCTRVDGQPDRQLKPASPSAALASLAVLGSFFLLFVTLFALK